ncbi:MAG: DUF371 domain-containing protein [Candidatus Bathyarchaeota archaeon]|nr:MAG: DUF371 domain-containing protein [Candidatus Bathyarchaeota archaeon]
MRVVETIEAWGHPNINATHTTTLELTKTTHLTQRGDCIVAVNASKGIRDLSLPFKQMAKHHDAQIIATIEAGGYQEAIIGRGHPQLLFSHSTDLVVRKSDYVCDRTLMIGATKAAVDLSRNLVEVLQNPSQRVVFTIMIMI